MIQVPAFAACGVTSAQWDPPSTVRRIRFVPEPAAHPVLALIMRIDAGGSSGYGASVEVGVGYGVGFTLADGIGDVGGVTPTE